MKQNHRVNVGFVATVSAILLGVLSVVFVPFFSTLLLSLSAPVARSVAADTGMLLAVVTPLVCMGAGFAFGALMAFGYNMFVWALVPAAKKTEVVIEEELVTEAVVGDAA